jgi:hypothetical protein
MSSFDTSRPVRVAIACGDETMTISVFHGTHASAILTTLHSYFSFSEPIERLFLQNRGTGRVMIFPLTVPTGLALEIVTGLEQVPRVFPHATKPPSHFSDHVCHFSELGTNILADCDERMEMHGEWSVMIAAVPPATIDRSGVRGLSDREK